MEYRIESYQINPGTSAWDECDKLCFKSKNLYNAANYIVRQAYLKKDGTGKYLNCYDMIPLMYNSEQYKSLTTKICQTVLGQLHQNWLSYFKAKTAYYKDPSKFLAKPKPPNYKQKDGRNSVTFTNQMISKRKLKHNLLKLTELNFLTPLRTAEHVDENGVVTYKFDTNIRDVTLVPFNDCYKLIVKYEDVTEKTIEQNDLCAGVDIGLNNLAAIATNSKQLPSLILNGKPLKNINSNYNKQRAKLQSKHDLSNSKREQKRIQKEIQQLTRKRNNKIKHELHQLSSMLVTQLSSAGISRLVVGKNDGWKQEINMGTKNNQNFVSIPHAKFVDMLKYKWERIGGRFETIEESYTSKCSFLDNEVIGKHAVYMGNRKHRGLFVSSKGFMLNADINGAGNILRKVVSNAWANWSNAELIKGFVANPPRLTARFPVQYGK